jgi:hypothetical protein
VTPADESDSLNALQQAADPEVNEFCAFTG